MAAAAAISQWQQQWRGMAAYQAAMAASAKSNNEAKAKRRKSAYAASRNGEKRNGMAYLKEGRQIMAKRKAAAKPAAWHQ
jgi:hypothetical protein